METVEELKAQLQAAQEQNAILQSQVDNADVNLAQLRISLKGEIETLRQQNREHEDWQTAHGLSHLTLIKALQFIRGRHVTCSASVIQDVIQMALASAREREAELAIANWQDRRQEGRVEALELLTREQASTFEALYMKSSGIADTGDSDVGWDYAALRNLFRAESRSSLIESQDNQYWSMMTARFVQDEPTELSKAQELLRKVFNLVSAEFTFRRHTSVWKMFQGIQVHDELEAYIKGLRKQAGDEGPDVEDGHTWEGFPGGCERFGCAPGCSKDNPQPGTGSTVTDAR